MSKEKLCLLASPIWLRKSPEKEEGIMLLTAEAGLVSLEINFWTEVDMFLASVIFFPVSSQVSLALVTVLVYWERVSRAPA